MAQTPNKAFAADPKEGPCLLRVVTGNFDANEHKLCGHLAAYGSKEKGRGKIAVHYDRLISNSDVIVMSEMTQENAQSFIKRKGYKMYAVYEVEKLATQTQQEKRRYEVTIFVHDDLKVISSDVSHKRWVRVTVKVPGTEKQINIIGVHFEQDRKGEFPFDDLCNIAKAGETLILGDFNGSHPHTFWDFKTGKEMATPGAPVMDRRTVVGEEVDLRVSEAPLHGNRTDFVVQTNPSLNVCGRWFLHPCFSHYFSDVRLSVPVSVDTAAAGVLLLAAAVAGVAAVAAAAVQLRDGGGAAHVVAPCSLDAPEADGVNGVALAGAVAADAAGQVAAAAQVEHSAGAERLEAVNPVVACAADEQQRTADKQEGADAPAADIAILSRKEAKEQAEAPPRGTAVLLPESDNRNAN